MIIIIIIINYFEPWEVKSSLKLYIHTNHNSYLEKYFKVQQLDVIERFIPFLGDIVMPSHKSNGSSVSVVLLN